MDKMISEFASDYEKLIESISGVISSKIILDSNNEIEEIHVLTSTEKNPKQISRDIQSAIAAKFESILDHKRISIAQIEDALLSERKEIKFLSFENVIKNNVLKAKVDVEISNNTYSGISEGLFTRSSKNKYYCMATLEAVNSSQFCDAGFMFEDLKVLELSNKSVVIVAITKIFEGKEELLTGTSVVVSDMAVAVVKATIEAISKCDKK